MKIHGSEQTINKVFSDDFAFEIPHYQRPYSWTLGVCDCVKKWRSVLHELA